MYCLSIPNVLFGDGNKPNILIIFNYKGILNNFQLQICGSWWHSRKSKSWKNEKVV